MPKLGCLSGSRFGDMMTSGRGNKDWGVTSEKLAIRIAAERLGLLELDLDGYQSQAMIRGNEEEESAIQEYERTKFVEVHSKQVWQQHPDYEYVGITPDGLIGSKGVLEVKNPDSENHLFHILNGKQLKEYHWQIHGSLWVSGRAYVDFVSHDSRVKGLRLHVTRVQRNEKIIKQIDERYHEFEEKVSEYTNQVNEIIETLNKET